MAFSLILASVLIELITSQSTSPLSEPTPPGNQASADETTTLQPGPSTVDVTTSFTSDDTTSRLTEDNCSRIPATKDFNVTTNLTSIIFNLTSPNYPNEYGKESSCTWNIDMTGVCVEIAYIVKDVHFQGSFGRKYCPGSYEILINGVKDDCLPAINESSSQDETHCYFFYDEAYQEPMTKCRNPTAIKDKLQIKYQSDGRTVEPQQTVNGFWMEINVTLCRPRQPSTSNGSTDHIMSPITTQGNTPIGSTDDFDFKTMIIILGAIAGFSILALIGVIIYVVKNKNTQSLPIPTTPQPPKTYWEQPMEEPQPPVYETPPDAHTEHYMEAQN